MPGPEDSYRRRITVEFNDGTRQTLDADNADAARQALIDLQRRQGVRTFVVVGEDIEEPPPDAGTPDAGDDPSRTVDAARHVQRIYGTQGAYEARPRPPERRGGVQAGMAFEAPLRATAEDPTTGERVTFESYEQEQLDRQVDDFMRGREREQRALELIGGQRLPGKKSDVPMSRYPSDEMQDEWLIRPGAKR